MSEAEKYFEGINAVKKNIFPFKSKREIIREIEKNNPCKAENCLLEFFAQAFFF